MKISYSATLEWDFRSGVSTLLDLTIRSIIQKSWRDAIVQRRQCAKLDKNFNGMYAEITIDSKFRNVMISWKKNEIDVPFVISTTSTSSTPLNEKIQMKMEQYASKLNVEFRVWKNHCRHVLQHCFDVFNRGYNVDIFNYLDDFIYDSYGSIDYTEMAKKMLTCDELEKEVRFAIACEFCFEHEIKELWPLVANRALLCSGKIKGTMPNYSLAEYWVAVLTNQRPKVPIRFGGHNPTIILVRFSHTKPTDFTDIPATMFIGCSHTKPAMEFFWKHIPTFDGQVLCIGKCFDNLVNEIGMIVLLEHWIPRMNDEFLKSLVKLHGTHMMSSMLKSRLCYKFVLPFWHRTCIMYDSDQFVTFLVEFTGTKDTRIKYLCEQIWNIASIEFKNHASNRIAAQIATNRCPYDDSMATRS